MSRESMRTVVARCALATGVAVPMSLLVASEASSFPEQNLSDCSNDGTTHLGSSNIHVETWHNVSNADFQGKLSQVTEGIERWETVNDADGHQLVTVEYFTNGMPDGGFEWFVNGGGPVTECGPLKITIRDVIVGAKDDEFPGLLRANAQHETGHALGLRHTSVDANDNINTGVPSLATCLSFEAAAGRPAHSKDDWVSLLGYHSFLELAGDEPVSANFGFENGINYWSTTGGARSASLTSPMQGSRSMRYVPSVKGGQIYQETQMIPDGGLGIWPHYNARVASSSHSGLTVQQLSFKRNDYKAGDCFGDDQWTLPGLNLNKPDVGQNLGYSYGSAINSYLLPTTTWSGNGSTEQANKFNVPTAWDAVDIMHRVYSYVTDGSGDPAPVYFDNVTGYQ